MAGNIIPAIATTNAIVAGFMVIDAIKIVSGNSEKCKDIYLQNSVKAPSLFMSQFPEKSKDECVVCKTNYFELKCTVETTTLNTILEEAKGMGIDGEVTIEEGGRLIYDFDLEDNLNKTLKDMNISYGSRVFVTLEDDGSDETYLLCLFISEGYFLILN
jgi:ubiquitin-like 1-activating enzyme E1 B